jgi:hypothetical protein
VNHATTNNKKKQKSRLHHAMSNKNKEQPGKKNHNIEYPAAMHHATTTYQKTEELFAPHCTKNPIYVFPKKELRSLSPNSYILGL